MKWIAIFVLAAVLLWLGFNQKHTQEKLAALEAENQKLTAEVAQKSDASPDDKQRVTEARLEQAQLALTAAEQRLSNMAAQLEMIRQRLQAASPSGELSELTPPTSATLSARAPASSHTADGELRHRNWGPEQVVGPPDTMTAGDLPTAWASRNPTGGAEWLKLEYAKPLDLAEIRVHETHNPGSIARVTAFLPNGQEVTIWQGVEPASDAPVQMSFPVNTAIRASSVKVYLDTTRVSGWNEIDAVEMVGRDGARQWATAVTASSTYAEP